MTARIIDMATRTKTTPFAEGPALMQRSSALAKEALAQHGLTMRLTQRARWALMDEGGLVGHLFPGEHSWHLSAIPGHEARLRTALEAVLATPAQDTVAA